MRERSRRLRALGLVVLLFAEVGLAAPPQEEIAREVTRAERAWKRAKEPVERLELLDELAALYERCTAEEQRVAATLAIARGLADEDAAVHETALGLLATGLHRETAIDSLLAGSRSLCARMVALEAEIAKGREDEELDLRPKKPKPTDVGRDLRELSANLDGVQAVARSLVLWALSSEYVVALRGIRDDRAVEGLCALAETVLTSPNLHDGLADFGTGPALRAAARNLALHEELRAPIAARAEAIRSYEIGRKPGWFKGTREAWIEREEQRMASLLQAAEEQLAEVDGWAGPVAERWRAFAQTHGLEPPPEEVWMAKAWTSWAEEQAKSLPASVLER